MASSQRSISGRMGVDYDERIAGTGTNSDEGNEFAVGTLDCGTDGTEYVYVHAAGAIDAFALVTVDENFEVIEATQAAVADGHMVGVAQAAFADNEFGWVAIKGANLTVQAVTATAADTALNISGTAGQVDDAGTTLNRLDGIVLVATGTTTGSEALLTWPRSAAF